MENLGETNAFLVKTTKQTLIINSSSTKVMSQNPLLMCSIHQAFSSLEKLFTR